MVHLKHILTSLVLALLVSLSGCAQAPPGLDVTLSFTGSPLGFGISIKNPPQITASGPSGFAVGTPVAPDPVNPATNPATEPGLPRGPP